MGVPKVEKERAEGFTQKEKPGLGPGFTSYLKMG
jgi:hypothetical protein